MKWDEWRDNMNGKPVMWTKHLFTFRGWRWSLHKFVGPDESECYHSHPAVAYRLILWGWYQEAIVDDEFGGWSLRDFRTWRFLNYGKVTPDLVHNICAVSKVCYTLWIRGPKTHKIQLIGNGWKNDNRRSNSGDQRAGLQGPVGDADSAGSVGSDS